MDEILGRIHQREEAAVRRERAMAYAFSHQWRANSGLNLGLVNYELGKANWGWSWKERWIAARPWESRVPAKSISPKKAKSRPSKAGENTNSPANKATKTGEKTNSPSTKASKVAGNTSSPSTKASKVGENSNSPSPKANKGENANLPTAKTSVSSKASFSNGKGAPKARRLSYPIGNSESRGTLETITKSEGASAAKEQLVS
ncbi:hypothetical protein Tsubulata_011855 [Turnera subulata]|uniref:DUF4005 domain-containing protein n=1 Tax=Turnera subulata TaxID=218843 RepID=A0A9Q0GAY4_9ROSI|nr:hypothetical protein Tsubulata_011855 [Turnera subulata]